MLDEPTVFVIDDNEANRHLLQELMGTVDLPVETYDSGQQFLDMYQAGRRGCIILDIRMPKMSGLEVQSKLHEQSINLPVIMATAHGDVAVAVQALKAGAFDFIEKPFSNQVMLDMVYQALDADSLAFAQETKRNDIQQRFHLLTPRERDVLEHVLDGTPNKVTAHCLRISEGTVEVHRRRVMKKMQAQSLAALVKMIVILKNGND